jgi:2Fe-2S ferredoxin
MKIKFVPTLMEVEATSEKTLLQICVDNKIEIRSICKGVPSCAECRIRIVEGEHNVLPPSKAELNVVGTNYFIDQRRLSCQVRCFGGITVDISEQLDQKDNQNKKVRGFRAMGQKGAVLDSKAVQGTLVLEEPPPPPAPTAKPQQAQQQRPHRKPDHRPKK